ncbi:MAG: hypothetical protein AAB733_04555, partial [Patescibacteria group bacterium]
MESQFFSRRVAAFALCGFVFYEILTMFAVFLPQIEPWIFTALIFGMLVVAWEDRALAYFVLVAESLIGSVGAGITLDVLGRGLNLRQGFSLVILIAFLPAMWKERCRLFDVGRSMIPFLLVMGAGILLGWFRGNAIPAVINDADGFSYLLLLLPALIATKDVRAPRWLFSVLSAAVLVIVIKTLLVFVLMLQVPAWGDVLYFWMRNATRGFFTYYNGLDMFRVGIAAHIHLLFPLFWILLALRNHIISREAGWWKWAVFGIASSILIDFSRSLWVGAAIGLAAVVVLWRKSKHCSTQVSLIGMIAAVLAFSFLFVAFVAKTNRFEAYQIGHGRGE